MRMATQDTSAGNREKMTKIPVVGEVPSVLAPVIVIGFIGILSSFVVTFQQRDVIIGMLESVNPPPPKVTKIDVNKCRGICSNQDESFESLQNIMNSFKKTPEPSSVPSASIPVSQPSKPAPEANVVSEQSSEPLAVPTPSSELSAVPLSSTVE